MHKISDAGTLLFFFFKTIYTVIWHNRTSKFPFSTIYGRFLRTNLIIPVAKQPIMLISQWSIQPKGRDVVLLSRPSVQLYDLTLLLIKSPFRTIYDNQSVRLYNPIFQDPDTLFGNSFFLVSTFVLGSSTMYLSTGTILLNHTSALNIIVVASMKQMLASSDP